jgi:hypothetical protein
MFRFLFASGNVLNFLLGSTTFQIFPTFESVLALNAHLSQKVKGFWAILFVKFSTVLLNGCGELGEFREVGGSLDVVGDRILPFFQPAVRDKLSASIAPMHKHHISPRFHSLN